MKLTRKEALEMLSTMEDTYREMYMNEKEDMDKRYRYQDAFIKTMKLQRYFGGKKERSN